MIERSFGKLRIMWGPSIEEMARMFEEIEKAKRKLEEKDKGDDRHS